MSFRLIVSDLGTGLSAVILARTSTDSFIERITENSKEQQRASLIIKEMRRVSRNGIGWAMLSGRLKALDADAALYELRIPGRVIRVMTYIHHHEIPVYLFDFNRHQGKRGNVPRHIIDRGKKLAAIAARLMTEEHND